MKCNKIDNEGTVLYLPVKMAQITKIEAEQKLNEHATIEIHGILDEGEEMKNICSMGMQDRILLKKNHAILFSGVPVYVDAEKEGDVINVRIRGNSRSILLDDKKKKRSFQKTGTYMEMMEKAAGSDAMLVFQKELKDMEKKQLHVQYEETDWEFLKRMASLIHAPVCPDITAEKTNVFIGVPDGKEHGNDFASYQMRKDIEEYLRFHEQDPSATDKQFVSVMVHSFEHLKIGDAIIHEGYQMTVTAVKIKYTDSMPEYTYRLRNRKGIKWRKKYNPGLSGISINGTIIKSDRDNVKLHLEIDKSQPEPEALYFQVAVGYTAEGSTGVYAAMDEGEGVKLYFPTADEKDAYVRCVNKKDSHSSTHFAKPATKSFGTPYGSCMSATERGILISAVKDRIYIKMDENEGIEIHSSEKIEICAEKKLDMKCKKLSMESQDKIILQTSANSIIVDETMHLKAK